MPTTCLSLSLLDVTIASIIELPEDAFYKGIPDGGYGW
jgi:hypothetical protein